MVLDLSLRDGLRSQRVGAETLKAVDGGRGQRRHATGVIIGGEWGGLAEVECARWELNAMSA